MVLINDAGHKFFALIMLLSAPKLSSSRKTSVVLMNGAGQKLL